MTALIVKEDGLIYAAEVPHLHEFWFYGDYDEALDDAKESAVLVSDQVKATKLVLKAWRKSIGEWMPEKFLPVGIYPIPDLQWEVGEHPTGKVLFTDTPSGMKKEFKPVAILKESTPSTEQESQENERLMDELLTEYRQMRQRKATAFSIRLFLCDKFNITRKP